MDWSGEVVIILVSGTDTVVFCSSAHHLRAEIIITYLQNMLAVSYTHLTLPTNREV